MKKVLFLVVVIITCICCSQKKQKSADIKYYPKEVKDSTFIDLPVEEQNKILDSLTAEGEAVIIRGSKREYDTIIDHIRYKYIKEE